MEDQKILDLFFARSEQALEEMRHKYGARAQQMAGNLLKNAQDGEECVNDALLALWERIPPERPLSLWAYYSRVLRNLCCSRLDYLCADKRDRGQEICLSELETCFISRDDPACRLESARIGEAIDRFLETQDSTGRKIFVRRYYYFDSCGQIAQHMGMTRGAVNTRLSRMRQTLKEYLQKEDIYL